MDVTPGKLPLPLTQRQRVVGEIFLNVTSEMQTSLTSPLGS